MKKIMSFCLLACFMIVWGNGQAEVNDGLGGNTQGKLPAVKPGTPLPPNHPPMPGMMPNKTHQPSMQAPEGPVLQGKVLEVTNGAGYSYLKLESGGKSFWVAGTQVNAKKGDIVSYVENVVMEKFYSKTLNKTFDRIIFASSVKVVQ